MNVEALRKKTFSAWWILLPLTVFLIHACWLGRYWIIDDAGISFAYARNLADGWGLVSQPTVAPVEGFSNPLWVFLLAPFFLIHAFDLFWTPKILSAFLVIASFIVTLRCLAKYDYRRGGWVAVIGLTLVSFQPAFVIWCVSGLENPLTVFLISMLLALCINFTPDKHSIRQAGLIGVLSAALALNRPDGILYAGIFPLCLLIYSKQKRSGVFYQLVVFLGTCLLPLLVYLAFRFQYFGAGFPNTYYAKGGVSAGKIWGILTLHPEVIIKLEELFGAAGGVPLGGWLLLLTGSLSAIVFLKYRNNRVLVVSGLGTLISMGIYLLLPYDWMPEFRFATPFFLCFYLFISSGYCALVNNPSSPNGWRVICHIVAVLFCVGVLSTSVTRAFYFKYHMPIPISEVLDTSQRFERYSQQLQIQNPSILIADVGGFLYRNGIRVYDLGMLCDRTIAATLGEGIRHSDVARFHDYVFDEIKPTFIATRAYHSWIADLESDPRFRECYTPIFEYKDKWIFNRYEAVRFSGDFIRKEAILGKKHVFEQIKKDATSVPYAGL